MTQQRQIYRVNQLTLNEMNRIYSYLADRLDELEGFRGSPTIRSPLTSTTLKVYAKDDADTLLHGMGDV